MRNHIDEATRREAAEYLMRLYGDDVMRICLMALKDFYLAQDACQETFFRVWKYHDGFRHESSEKTWVFHIAVNVCRDMKKASWYRQGKGTLPLEENHLLLQDDSVFHGPVTEAVLALPEKYRLVLLLHYYHALKGPEIARILQVPYPTVLTRLHRGRELVRRTIEEGGAKHETKRHLSH